MLPQPPRGQPTCTVKRDACPAQKNEGCRILESGLAAGSQLWEPQESGRRNSSLCFRNITWKVSGAAARRSDIPHFIYAGRRGQGRGADGTVPPGSGGTRAPGRLAGGPIPSRPDSRSPAPLPVRPAGRWATVAAAAHRELGGNFFLISSHLSSSECRATARTAQGRAGSLTSIGERSKERSGRDGRRGGR